MEALPIAQPPLLERVLFAASVAVSPGQANFYSYFEWTHLSETQRAGYVAGMVDSYETFSLNYFTAAKHLSDCLQRVKLTNVQLSEAVLAYAASRPDVQTEPMPTIILNYLFELCGRPPSN